MTPGTTVGGRFVIERKAGSGGMSTVFRAYDRQLGSPVALKLLHGNQSQHRARFEREAELLRALEHPHIVRYLAHGTMDSGDLFLATEWLEGDTLLDYLRDRVITVGEAITLGQQVSRALEHAHAHGVVHRDLKPGNLFLTHGSLNHLKLIDFGVARVAISGQEMTKSGQMLGTPGYMSPEQARGDKTVDHRADLFALGCVLYRSLVGQTPFLGEDAMETLIKSMSEPAPRLADQRSDIPQALDELVTKMLAKSPLLRPASAKEVEGTLNALAQQGSAAAIASPTSQTPAETSGPYPGQMTPTPDASGAHRSMAPSLPGPYDHAPQAKTPWGLYVIAISVAMLLGMALAVAVFYLRTS